MRSGGPVVVQCGALRCNGTLACPWGLTISKRRHRAGSVVLQSWDAVRFTWDVRSISTSAPQHLAKLCSTSVVPPTHTLAYCISWDVDPGDSDIPDAKHVTLRMPRCIFEEFMGKSTGRNFCSARTVLYW